VRPASHTRFFSLPAGAGPTTCRPRTQIKVASRARHRMHARAADESASLPVGRRGRGQNGTGRRGRRGWSDGRPPDVHAGGIGEKIAGEIDDDVESELPISPATFILHRFRVSYTDTLMHASSSLLLFPKIAPSRIMSSCATYTSENNVKITDRQFVSWTKQFIIFLPIPN
jgi:hypothetical protein